MHAKTDGSFLPAAGPKPHKWGRCDVLLPRQTLEAEFPKKARAHARLRRRLQDDISSVLPSHVDSCQSAASTSGPSPFSSRSRPSPFSSRLSSRPSTSLDSVEPRYLLTSRVNYSRSQTPYFKLFPQRPGTAPEFQTSIASQKSQKLGIAPEFLDLFEPSPEVAEAIELEEHLRSVSQAISPTVPEAPAISQTLQIVESPTTFTVETEKGNQKVPRHHWVVLEPAGSDLPNQDSFVGRKLLKELGGGGTILSQGAQLLHLVPEDRLHAVAAEANFKRASHSTSMLTLRHAAYIMELLSQRYREVETGAMSATLESCLSSSARTDIDHEARLKGLSRMVRDQAIAAQNREVLVPPIQVAQTFQIKTLDMDQHRDRLLKGRSKLRKGVQCLEEFHKFIFRRYGNSVRAWFALDIEENMKIGEKLFIRRVIEIGFRGDISAMYRYVDSDRSGSITILELDSNAAMTLAEFKKFLNEHFHGSPDACFSFMDRNRIGRLSRDDVVSSLNKLHFDSSNTAELFDLLDREGLGFVVPRDLFFLRKWQPRAYLFVKPDETIMRNIKEAFTHVHGTPWRAWRTALDPALSMRVSFDEFFIACRKLWKTTIHKSIVGISPLPTTEEDIAAGWRTLDYDCSGWIPLKAFDYTSYKVLKSFKHWTMSEHGSCILAFRALDITNNGKLNTWELRKSDTRPTAYPGDVDRLFEYLDWDKQRAIGEQEVKFLDDWDVDWEEYEEYAKGRRRTTVAGMQTGREMSNLLLKPCGTLIGSPRPSFSIPFS